MSLLNPDEGGLRFGALTLPAVIWCNLSVLTGTLSKSGSLLTESRSLAEATGGFTDWAEELLGEDDVEQFGLFMGGFGLGGGVDLPKECLLVEVKFDFDLSDIKDGLVAMLSFGCGAAGLDLGNSTGVWVLSLLNVLANLFEFEFFRGRFFDMIGDLEGFVDIGEEFKD